ncbi:hypothetical protein BGW38_002726 [Lunasporangiospora selenospora]|uniref:F-box domain-containing protein n=1 Tax=Lunasporangiospora selenospora TaxID=979761 RepID=A0A9P6FRY0_9FUNG|nr:hypothetical protein BGW38_002726 [Lunasporangiospora selenospora]
MDLSLQLPLQHTQAKREEQEQQQQQKKKEQEELHSTSALSLSLSLPRLTLPRHPNHPLPSPPLPLPPLTQLLSVNRVFEIPELVDCIVTHLRPIYILQLRLVSRRFYRALRLYLRLHLSRNTTASWTRFSPVLPRIRPDTDPRREDLNRKSSSSDSEDRGKGHVDAKRACGDSPSHGSINENENKNAHDPSSSSKESPSLSTTPQAQAQIQTQAETPTQEHWDESWDRPPLSPLHLLETAKTDHAMDMDNAQEQQESPGRDKDLTPEFEETCAFYARLAHVLTADTLDNFDDLMSSARGHSGSRPLYQVSRNQNDDRRDGNNNTNKTSVGSTTTATPTTCSVFGNEGSSSWGFPSPPSTVVLLKSLALSSYFPHLHTMSISRWKSDMGSFDRILERHLVRLQSFSVSFYTTVDLSRFLELLTGLDEDDSYYSNSYLNGNGRRRRRSSSSKVRSEDRGGLDTLQSLEIRHRVPDINCIRWRTFKDALSSLPQLKRLSLTGVGFCAENEEHDDGFGGSAPLEDRTIEPTVQFPGMQSLSLTLCRSTKTALQDLDRIFPQLTSLEINTSRSFSWLQAFLRYPLNQFDWHVQAVDNDFLELDMEDPPPLTTVYVLHDGTAVYINNHAIMGPEVPDNEATHGLNSINNNDSNSDGNNDSNNNNTATNTTNTTNTVTNNNITNGNHHNMGDHVSSSSSGTETGESSPILAPQEAIQHDEGDDHDEDIDQPVGPMNPIIVFPNLRRLKLVERQNSDSMDDLIYDIVSQRPHLRDLETHMLLVSISSMEGIAHWCASEGRSFQRLSLSPLRLKVPVVIPQQRVHPGQLRARLQRLYEGEFLRGVRHLYVQHELSGNILFASSLTSLHVGSVRHGISRISTENAKVWNKILRRLLNLEILRLDRPLVDLTLFEGLGRDPRKLTSGSSLTRQDHSSVGTGGLMSMGASKGLSIHDPQHQQWLQIKEEEEVSRLEIGSPSASLTSPSSTTSSPQGIVSDTDRMLSALSSSGSRDSDSSYFSPRGSSHRSKEDVFTKTASPSTNHSGKSSSLDYWADERPFLQELYVAFTDEGSAKCMKVRTMDRELVQRFRFLERLCVTCSASVAQRLGLCECEYDDLRSSLDKDQGAAVSKCDSPEEKATEWEIPEQATGEEEEEEGDDDGELTREPESAEWMRWQNRIRSNRPGLRVEFRYESIWP